MRVFQGVGAAFLLANSSAILTDAFPEHQRGMALGINQVAGISGSFIGLVLGGMLAPIQWRLIFLVSVPVGLFGTVWAYLKLREVPRAHQGQGRLARQHHLRPRPHRPDGRHHLRHPALRQPHMGWTSPFVLSMIGSGVALLAVFVFIENQVPDPMFRLALFKIRAFTAGSLATLLAAIGRGGLMFMLIIWLQGIWLPLHGYDVRARRCGPASTCSRSPPGSSSPARSRASCRTGSARGPSRPAGCSPPPLSFVLLELLPVNFSYAVFALAAAPERAGHGRVRRAQPGRGDEQPAGRPPGRRRRA